MSGEQLPELTKDDLEELLHIKVDNFTVSPLTAPGENYGSTMLLVDVTLLPDHEKISVVAKKVPKSPFMREIFQIHVTVRKEIYMYMRVQPEFQAIQEEYGVPEEMILDVIPKCLGARTTRGGDLDQPVDESSIILLENLKVSGYRLVDRFLGMDLKHLEYAVTHLARFQATAVVIKLKKPDVFKDTVLKAAARVRGGPPPDEDGNPSTLAVLKTISDIPIVRQHMGKIKKALEKEHEMFQGEQPEPREPFATLVHNDFWTNNMMFSYGRSNGENITGLKIFDFQMTFYGSPATDLLFLLYSSSTLDVSKDDCDGLIKLYHHEFTKWLELFGCDTEPFNFDRFLKEIETEALMRFAQVFMMLRIISLSESNVPDLSDKTEIGRVFKDNTGLGEIYFKKLERLIKEFVERNWL